MAKRTTRFSTPLREALLRFAEGVHDIPAPASTAAIDAARLPESLAELYRYADGLWLFDDLVRVVPLAEITRGESGLVVYCRTDGVQLGANDLGRVFEIDADGDRILAGESAEQDLLARIARESLLVDSDGEWRDAIGDDGDLLPAIRRKRNDVALRRAPHSARWLLEAAELALDLDGDPLPFLDEARSRDPEAPAPAELHGLLLSGHGDVAAGARALIVAADTSGATRKAERAAIAAEAAQRAQLAEERARMAALAIATEPHVVERLAREAEQALTAGRIEDGDRLGALARAVAGEAALPTRLRVRDRLRPVR